MEATDASRSNGASPEARDARNPPGPNGTLENGAKAEGQDAKTTNGHGGEAAEGKSLGGALKTGEGKSSLFSGNEWRRPIIQFVESVDDKGSSYFSMDSGDGKRSPYAGLQLGASRKPPLSFAEKGELRKSIFSEPRKPMVSIVEPGEARRNSYPRADGGLLLCSKSGSEEVLCDSCIGNKQKAVKSCLVCQASFCEPHLKPHLEGAAFRDHKLLEPIRDFEARKCPLHGKTMELFCQTDQTCICYLCMFQEHKNHSTVTVEEAKAEKETLHLRCTCLSVDAAWGGLQFVDTGQPPTPLVLNAGDVAFLNSFSLRLRLGQPGTPPRPGFLAKSNYSSRVWEYSSTIQNSDEGPAVQGSSSFSLKGYPSLIRSQSPKAQPQTWKSGKQTLLSHYRPFYVNKGNGMGSNEAP
ncbi:tripartite motif-containing protein 29-like [Leptonychotes weddellii]|uniref:Tripartite motif-containing protein 29 n=1 Tax=Leptonychotes weddellii TaxID=9713 RepID=A0A2U3Z2F9_LEPWE|nr:tripartite motif-containing protein 29-like [Leptonychotes weddellii]